jgi:hypothetical protein
MRRAERKAGALLREMEKARAGRPPQNPLRTERNFRGAPTLKDLGISEEQSHRWQQLADVPFRTRARAGTPLACDAGRWNAAGGAATP